MLWCSVEQQGCSTFSQGWVLCPRVLPSLLFQGTASLFFEFLELRNSPCPRAWNHLTTNMKNKCLRGNVYTQEIQQWPIYNVHIFPKKRNTMHLLSTIRKKYLSVSAGRCLWSPSSLTEWAQKYSSAHVMSVLWVTSTGQHLSVLPGILQMLHRAMPHMHAHMHRPHTGRSLWL